MMAQLRAHPVWVGVGVGVVIAAVVAGIVWWIGASGGTGPTAEPGAPQVPEVPATTQPADCGDPTIEVTTASELEDALDAAQPGEVIALASGKYEGEFRATASGTEDEPISLCGDRMAVLDGGGVRRGYVFHLDGADYWHLSGFTVTNGQKGVMADGTTGSVIEGLTVTVIGDEAIHLRSGSTDNLVTGNTISETGQRRDRFGEGIYVGTAESNWCDITNCEPDASDRNVIEGNTITATTAEAIDIKEGTSDGIVRDNTFDGSQLQGDADSWVDVKGNGWLIEGNVGAESPGDGFQTHEIVDGWGTDNVFRNNSAEVNGPGYGFALTPELANQVECDNTATGAAQWPSNTTCTD